MILCETNDDKMRLALTLNQIGILEKKAHNFPNSIAYLERALDLFRTLDDSEQMAHIYNNIGSAYKLSNDYARAREYLLKAIDINKRANNNKSLSYNYNNLANVFEEMGDLSEALDYHLKSIEIKTDLKDNPMLASSYSNLAIIYEKQGDLSEAKKYVKMAKVIAIKERVNEIIPVVLEQEANLLASTGNFEASNRLLSQLVNYQDSLTNRNKASLTKLYERNLESRKAGANSAPIKSGSDETNEVIVLVLVAICAIMLFSVLIIFYTSFKKRSRSELKLEAYKKAESNLRKQILELQKTNNLLSSNIDRIEHDKDVFFSTVSHDMRGPLNAINAIVSMLKKQAEMEVNEREEIIVLDYSVRSLIAVTDDILDFSYIESGRLRIEHKPFSLNDLLDDMLEVFAFISNEKEIDLIAEIETAPNKMIGDPRRLRQVLFNLLQNAFKFTREGFVRIALQLEEVDQNHQKITLEIEDTGIGISKIKLEDIFNKFFQANPINEMDKGGSGLGLYISKSLIEQMNGELLIQSKVDEGSKFTIRLVLPIAHQA